MTPEENRNIELAAEVRTVLHRLVKVLRRQTRNEATLSLTERSTLGLLDQHGKMLPNELAQIEKVTAQSMSQVVNHLVALDYIRKSPSEDDKRKVILSLTNAGKDYLEKSRREKQEWLVSAFHESLSPEEKETVHQSMQILKRLLDR
jgi:DNA-binding MarR family transcriptional regulator